MGIARILRSRDRKSTRLNSSHSQMSYAVFCLKKKGSKIEPMHGCGFWRSAGRNQLNSLFAFSKKLFVKGLTFSSQSSAFFFNDTATTEIYTLSLHDALPIYPSFKPQVLVAYATVLPVVLAF